MDSFPNRAIFLDRDGVICIDKNYQYEISEFEFTDGIFEVLAFFYQMNFKLIIITNQSGIGRGFFTLEDFCCLNNWMLDEFSKKGIQISKVYFCPHSPSENCNCRKPNPQLILNAVKDFGINLNKSYFIGDKKSDIQAGINAGVGTNILFNEEKQQFKADYKIDNISDLLNIIK